MVSRVSAFGVWSLGFEVWGLGFGVWSLEFGGEVLKLRVKGARVMGEG